MKKKILIPLDEQAVPTEIRVKYPIRSLPKASSLVVRMDVTNNCNLKCIHCTLSANRAFLRESASYMEVAQFRKIAEEVFPYAKLVALSCEAEPTIHPDFLGILKVLDDIRGPKYILTTHGMLLNEELITEIFRVGVSGINLSIDGATAETFERIRKKGKFSKIIEALESIQKLKRHANLQRNENPITQVNFTLMKSTINELPQMVEMCKKYEIGCLTTQHLYCLDQNELIDESLSEDLESAEKILKACKEECERSGIIARFPMLSTDEPQIVQSVQKQQKLYCYAPWNMVRIRWNSDVFPCDLWGSEDSFGNLRYESFKDIWTSYEYTRLRWDHACNTPSNPKCQNCTMITTDNLEAKDVATAFVLSPQNKSPSKLGSQRVRQRILN